MTRTDAYGEAVEAAGASGKIAARRDGKALRIQLTRQEALNALDQAMCLALRALFLAADADSDVAVVVIEAAPGRAFCAGGDVKSIYEARNASEPAWRFFRDEYRMNRVLGEMATPVVACVDGIVMGGGVGVSVHARHRIVTESTMFAMPEVGIGLIPDVGATWALPRFAAGCGLWLGLTGARVKAGDCLAVGYGTAFVPSERLSACIDAICDEGDPDAAIARFSERPDQPIAGNLDAIADWFAYGDFDSVIARLERAAPTEPLAADALARIRAASPTSVRLAHEQLSRGRRIESLADALTLEFRVVSNLLLGSDLYEGIRAAVIDKSVPPAWKPATLEAVRDDEIARHFTPGPFGDVFEEAA